MQEPSAKTKLFHGEDVRKAMLSGIGIVGTTLRTTLGPRGGTVCQPPYQHRTVPRVSHDGKSIMEEMFVRNRLENIGVQIAKQVIAGVDQAVHGGTKTAIILAQQMIREGYRLIAAGVNPMSLLGGIEIAIRRAVHEIHSLSIPVRSYTDLHNVIRTSLVDDELAGVMTQAAQEVGGHGLLHIWRGYSQEKITVDFTRGMKYQRGLISPYFLAGQNSDRLILEHPKILVVDGNITSAQELVPLLNQIKLADCDTLYLVARSISSDALALLLANHERRILTCAVTNAPGFGHLQSEMLEDIAVFIGGRAIGDQYGLPLRCANVSDLGDAEQVIVTRNETTILGGKATSAVQARIQSLERLKQSTHDSEQLRYIKERIARLAGATAILSIGGSTEVERNELLARVRNAAHVMTVAEEEGIVPGGGVAYLYAADALAQLYHEYDEETGFGIEIVRRALEEPIRQMAENCGKSGEQVINTIRQLHEEQQNHCWGFNIQTGEYCNLMEAGVVEPSKLSRLVLGYAASSAAIVLTVDVMVVQA